MAKGEMVGAWIFYVWRASLV